MKRRKPTQLRKTEFIGFRLSFAERRFITLAAQRRNQSLSAFICDAAMTACQEAGVFAQGHTPQIDTYTQLSFQ